MAQQHPDFDRLQLEITPLFGYRTSMSFTTEPAIEGVTSKVVFGSNPSYGVGAGFRFHDEDVVELRWARQDTRIHVIGPVVVPSSERVLLDQFHLDLSHEYVVNEWPAWARPYVLGSVGATHVSGSASVAGFTRFSFGIGAGIKVFPSRQLGFKMQAEWLPLWLNPKARAFCNGGCIIYLSGKLGSQGEVTIGPVFRF